LQKNLRGEIVQSIPAVNGGDVRLTLRLDLQTAVYDLLARRVPELCPFPAGAAAVVVHVPTREVLALVSYPGYDANTFKRQYNHLRSDTRFTPLRFRAVANAYEPGSIVKPLTCLAGLASHVIDTQTTFHCNGHYLPGVLNAWRCWQVAGTGRRMRHGDVDVSAALAGSCNIFMYSVADRVGVNRLTNFFDMLGFGKKTGLGLIEEREGINPTPDWLMRNRNAPATLGRARNFAIGQGELNVTPVQAANLMACYASGRWQALTLFADGRQRPVWNLPGSDRDWRAIRSGLFRVVNDLHGTAHRTAYWKNDRYALAGKTGSATTPEAPTHYQITYVNEDGERATAIVPAKTRKSAVEDFVRADPSARFDAEADVQPYAWFPPKRGPGEKRYAHAWFVGYLQPIDAAGEPLFDVTPPVAFAILVEFGGSGGYTTGPIGRDLSELLIRHLGPDLDPDVSWAGEGSTPDGSTS